MKTTLLPIGSIESHGPHLPLETDTIIAEELSKIVKEKLRDIEVTILHSIKKSPIRATRDSPGSINETPLDFIDSVFETAKKCRTETLFILSGHWGRSLKASLSIACSKIHEELGIDVYILDYFKAIPLEILESEHPKIEHAGETETSEVMALHPEMVEDVYKELKTNYPEPMPKCIYQAFTKNDLKTLQYWGEPAKASADKGKIIIEKVTDALSETIKQKLK